jgi:hypothetical protein
LTLPRIRTVSNEGFATYAQWLYNEHTGGYSAQQTAARSYASHPADDDFWTISPGEPGVDQMFKPAVYDRGAMALHALRVAVGDKDFFTALRTWTTQRRGGNGSVADFLALLQRVSGKNVDNIAQTGYSPPPAHRHHQPEYQQISRDSQQVWRLGDAEGVLGVPNRAVGAQERVRIQRMQVSEATLNWLVGVYRARPG